MVRLREFDDRNGLKSGGYVAGRDGVCECLSVTMKGMVWRMGNLSLLQLAADGCLWSFNPAAAAVQRPGSAGVARWAAEPLSLLQRQEKTRLPPKLCVSAPAKNPTHPVSQVSLVVAKRAPANSQGR